MKRVLYFLSLAAAAILLSQCAFREQDAPEAGEGVAFELFASSAETKTVNDGLSTKWEVGDELSVYHCVPGAKTPVFDGVFEIDDAEKGHAVGTVRELSAGNYDWFLFYPGSKDAPAQPGGDVLIDPQPSQDGYDSRDHLAGPGFPLGGNVENVYYTATPSVTLHPLLSVIEVSVTNAQAIPAKVKSVSFSASESIAGKFQAGWSGSFSEKGDNSKSVSLSVSGGSLLDQGSSACFYMGLKPFQAAAGSVLKLSVTMVTEDGREAVQEKELTLPSAVSFKSGAIKTLNISFSETFPEPKTYTFRKVTGITNGHHYLIVAEYNGVYYAGQYFDESVSSGPMNVREVMPVDDVITLQDTDGAFGFAQSEAGWVIYQSDGRYICGSSSDNISVNASPTESLKNWTVSFTSEGAAAIVNRVRQLKFNSSSTVMKFQCRLKAGTGVVPYLYVLENDALYEEEFKSKETIGFYGINGQNWLYNEGKDQISVLQVSSGISFRLLTPSTYTAVQATDMPSTFIEGASFEITIKRFVKLEVSNSRTVQVKVLKVDGDRVWMISGDGTGIIAKIN